MSDEIIRLSEVTGAAAVKYAQALYERSLALLPDEAVKRVAKERKAFERLTEALRRDGFDEVAINAFLVLIGNMKYTKGVRLLVQYFAAPVA